MGNHIFISYSRKDSACADQIYSRITDKDFSVWIDHRNIDVSTSWTKEIVKGVEEAAIFMLLWSANAKDSDNVQQEMDLALHHSFGAQKSLKVFVVKLDDTVFPSQFKQVQVFKMEGECTDVRIEELIDALPSELRVFNFKKPLEIQNMESVPETPLVRVPFDHDLTWGFKADIVGPREKRFPQSPQVLHVGLQFTRATTLNLVEDIYKIVGRQTDPIWMLHIMGTTNVEGTEYRLPPDAKLWRASCAYIQDTIKKVADERKTTLRVFAPIPAALLAGSMRGFERFWHVQLYHYEPTLNGYFLALDQERR
ncbi:MAG: toll/interleukin-1 receptor domain-containing protein [Anaerolineaceae bacterium]|nr:toll/interleukin-1 receptor domain-containing protein [Anaerolineaceae bacterium]